MARVFAVRRSQCSSSVPVLTCPFCYLGRAGLFLCTCLHSIVQETRRFVPEAVAFVTSVLGLACSGEVSACGCVPEWRGDWAGGWRALQPNGL